MLIPSIDSIVSQRIPSLSRRVNANSQRRHELDGDRHKLIKKGEC